MSEFHKEWRKWKRAVNASRRFVVKAMADLGYRNTVYTKRDKGRTIMMVHGKGKVFTEALVRLVRKANERWADRLVLNGTAMRIGVSKYLAHDNGHVLVLDNIK